MTEHLLLGLATILMSGVVASVVTFRLNAASGAIRADVSGAVELYAFVMANQTERLSGLPSDYLVSVDLVEYFSGLDFFAALPDSLEDALEAATATAWPAR